MMEVVLDTNIYTSDPWRGKAGFNALVKLAQSGKLRLHIPYLVKKEFVSQQVEIHEKHINSINAAVVQLQRRVPPDLGKKLDGVREHFSKIQEELIAYPESEFTKWIRDVHGTVHSVSDSHGAQVVEDYFEGVLPFKSRKSREDIPDSFIWRVIFDLAEKHEILYVVANDKKIRDACDSVNNIRTFETLDDFIKSDVCRAVLEEESAKENIQRLFKYLPAIFGIRQEEIQDQIIAYLEGTSIFSERLIPNISHVATIKDVEGLTTDIEVGDITSAQYYGNGVMVSPFVTQAEITIEYGLAPIEYHSLSAKRTERLSVVEREETLYTIEEIFPLSIAGRISIRINPQKILEFSLSEEEIKTLADGTELIIDSIEQKELIDGDPIQNRWEQQYLELVRYKEENGHCDVPRKHPLGSWVSNQRQRRRIGKLAKDRVERLNRLEFTWLTRTRDVFDDYIEQLLEYQKFYGHMNVPQQDKKYRQLGRWVNDQRTKKTRGTLAKEHEDGLNEIGFVWNAIEAKWNQRFSELKEFHAKFGNFEVSPQNNEYPKLYAWLIKLRRRKPTQERFEKLISIGYDWNIESKKAIQSRKVDEASWDEKLQRLKEYNERNGHFNVSYKEDKSLYDWLFKLRSRKPSDERLEKLSKIGFHWEPKTTKRKPPATWDENLNLLKLHFEKTGTFEISSTNQKNLYNWLHRLRRKKPTDEQIAKLKSIGFDWEKEKV